MKFIANYLYRGFNRSDAQQWVTIDGTVYFTGTFENIPAKYKYKTRTLINPETEEKITLIF